MRRNQGSISESASLAMFQQEHYLRTCGSEEDLWSPHAAHTPLVEVNQAILAWS